MITVTVVITNGLIIPRLGYYYDDWYMLWSGAARGTGLFVSLFSVDRPFIGVIYALVYRLIGENILGWHLITLFFRIVGGVAFYWILNLVWPKFKSLLVLAAMLFVVFPGFLAEPNAATKINHLIGYAAVLLSIGFSLQAVKTSRSASKYACFALSLALMALYLWIYEYMIGLEVMRVALLFYVLWQAGGAKVIPVVKKVMRVYWPYVGVAVLFVLWRAFIFKSLRPATNLRTLGMSYLTDPLGMLLQVGVQTVKDFLSAALFAWGVEGYHLLASADYKAIALAGLAAVVVILLAAWFIFSARKAEPLDPETGSPAMMIGIGALTTLGAVLPVVLTDHSINLMDPYKSYALHPSAGVIIMLLGIAALFKAQPRKVILITLLGIAAATQLLNVQVWANLWSVERTFWWQLTWRAPNIRDNTLLMAYAPDGYAFQQDYEVWGPVDLIYRPGPAKYPLIQAEVLNQDTLQQVFTGVYIEPHDRDIYVPR
ncbi:MAG TPA: hypothetical protein VF806_01040, partial [Anaerolineaceae bacterium]